MVRRDCFQVQEAVDGFGGNDGRPEKGTADNERRGERNLRTTNDVHTHSVWRARFGVDTGGQLTRLPFSSVVPYVASRLDISVSSVTRGKRDELSADAMSESRK